MARDERGRFVKGNPWASIGGQARAAALPVDRRREIGAMGWAALVDRRFAGDDAAARAWIGRIGVWADDQSHPWWMRVARHPGSPEQFLSAWQGWGRRRAWAERGEEVRFM